MATCSLQVHNSTLRESRFSRILENFFPISLLDLDLGAFSFHFSLSISISRHFDFTFHFSERVKAFQISLFFLEKKEWNMHFLSWKIQNFWPYISSWNRSPISYNNDLLVDSRSVIVTRLWKQMNFTTSRYKDKLNVTEKLSLSLFLFISITRQWSEQRCIQRFPTQSIHTALQVTCLNQGPSPKAFCWIPK